MDRGRLEQAVKSLKNSRRSVAFTGAGISVESGIPPFRGADGIWSKYNPQVLDIQYFLKYPDKAWVTIKEIFYDFFGKALPNPAHCSLADMEKQGFLNTVITQNIDNLHQQAGSTQIIEYHGNSQRLTCLKCHTSQPFTKGLLDNLPPHCQHCGGILKPDFVFFGESIPLAAQQMSLEETHRSDVWLVIGTTGEVYPAAELPQIAKANGKTIIEINTVPSNYTYRVTDIFLQGPAGQILTTLLAQLKNESIKGIL